VPKHILAGARADLNDRDISSLTRRLNAGALLPLLSACPLIIASTSAAVSGNMHVATAAICGTSSALLSIWGLVQLVGRCEIVEVSPWHHQSCAPMIPTTYLPSNLTSTGFVSRQNANGRMGSKQHRDVC